MQQNMHLKNMNKCEIKLDLKQELKNLQNKKSQYTIPIFIPHKGCRNECVFCNQRKISGKLKEVLPEEVDSIIKTHLEYFKNSNRSIEIAFFGGSFTGLETNLQEKYLSVANNYIISGKVSGIRISTRPDYISPRILRLLKKYNVKTIELGVQSLDNEVLNLAKRGHSKEDVIKASRLIKLYGFELGHQIMIGLPGSSIEKEINTAKEVVKILPSQLRIYPVYVISPSELYDMYLRGEYIPLEFDEAVYRTYEVVKKIQETNIKIIRLGLQSTEEICSSNEEIVGPVCDNFAEYVFTRIIRERIESEIKKVKEKIEILNLIVPKQYISLVIGPKKANKEYFKQKYEINLNIKGEL